MERNIGDAPREEQIKVMDAIQSAIKEVEDKIGYYTIDRVYESKNLTGPEKTKWRIENINKPAVEIFNRDFDGNWEAKIGTQGGIYYEFKESESKEVEEVIEITEGWKEETSNSFLEVEVKDGKVSIGVDFYTDEGTVVDEYEIENNLRLIQKFIYYLNSDMPNDETINIIEEAFDNGRIKELN